ncbi:hypothetical protein EXIGLDRAFT_782175, partial [Exidia glandulosa HHB12029]
MNVSDTSSDYYTRTLSPSPPPLDRPLDDEDSDFAPLLPLDRYIQAYRRSKREMQRHAEKKKLQQEEPDSDRGSTPPPSKAKAAKPPAPPEDPPSRMPAARKPNAMPREQSTRVTRQRATTEGIEVPEFELPVARKPPTAKTAATKAPTFKAPAAPLLNLPGPSPPVQPVKPTLKGKQAAEAVAAKTSLFARPSIRPAASLFGRTVAQQQPTRVTDKDPVAKTPTRKTAGRVLFQNDSDDEQDQDDDLPPADDDDDDGIDPMQVSPTQEHVQRRSSAVKGKKSAPNKDVGPPPRSKRFTAPPQLDDDLDDEEDVFGGLENDIVVEKTRGTKRVAPERSKNPSYEEVASPARKKVVTSFDHIVLGYEGDARTAMVPDCVRDI